MKIKQLTYPTIKEQEQFWIDKEAQQDSELTEAISNNATTHETRGESNLTGRKFCIPIVMGRHPDGSHCYHADICHLAIHDIAASNLSQSDSTTADPKPKDIGGNQIPDRIEANEDFYEAERNDFDRGDLQDEGRNPNGDGESLSERNQ